MLPSFGYKKKCPIEEYGNYPVMGDFYSFECVILVHLNGCPMAHSLNTWNHMILINIHVYICNMAISDVVIYKDKSSITKQVFITKIYFL